MAGYVQDAIMLLGDSITQGGSVPYGFAQQLSEKYNRKLDVLNRGFSGYNTRWIFPIFEKAFAKRSERDNLPKIRLLTIWLGANDACLPGEKQHVPIDEFADNLTKLIRMVKDPSSEWYSPETRIVVFTPPPINGPQWLADSQTHGIEQLDRAVDVTAKYAEAAKEVAKQEDVRVVDAFGLLWEAAGKEESKMSKFLYDGLHLNQEGYQLVTEELIRCIDLNYPELHYDRLEMAYPSWEDVSSENYRELLKDSAVKRG